MLNLLASAVAIAVISSVSLVGCLGSTVCPSEVPRAADAGTTDATNPAAYY